MIHNPTTTAVGRIRSILLLGTLFMAPAAFSSVPEAGEHGMEFTSSWDGTAQPYRLHVPPQAAAGELLPLAVVLHGRGVDEHAWFRFLPTGEAADRHGYVVAAPYARGNYWYRGPAEQDVLDIVDEVSALLPIDPDRVYLAGHSMGGWGTAWIALRNPDRFAAIAPMAGWAPPDLLASAHALRPLLIHDADDDIVPAGNSRDTAAGLARLGVSFQYVEETGYGHASSMITDNFDRMFQWFDAHRRDPSPTRIRFATRTPARGEAWWVRVIETERFPRTATVDARFDAEADAVRLQLTEVRQLALIGARMPGGSLPGRIVIEESGGAPGATLTVDSAEPAEALLLSRDAEGWTVRAQKVAELPRHESREVALPPSLAADGDDPVAFSRRWANLLRERAGADFAAFEVDMFRPMGTPLTEDGLIDTYSYPVEYLALVEISGQALAEWAAATSQALLVGEEEGAAPESDRIYRVATPANVALRIAGNVGELLPGRVADLLHEALVGDPE